jgi:hypothetical protein
MGDKAVTIGSQPTYEILDENTMATNSDKALPTQKSVKAYVDSSLGIGGITATAAEINKLHGAGAVVASGTQHAHVADAKTNYTAGELDTEGEIITALNATNTKVNTILAALEAFQINASA